MRPEDYRLVFVSSDSSCRDDTEDSSSTASSAAPPAPDDCDWDYFEPGTAGGATPLPSPLTNNSQNITSTQTCPKTCSCGAEPRIVAVPVPVPVPFPAALWPALLAFQNPSAIHHWSTYPGFPHFDAATLARITTAAAVAVTAAAAATTMSQTKTIETTSVGKTDKAIQSEASTSNNHDTIKNDTDNALDKQSLPLLDNSTTSDNMLIGDEVKSLVVLKQNDDVMPNHLVAENAFNSSSNSAESSDSESGIKRQSYDVTSGAPEEPATSDEDSEDSGGGGGGSFARVFVVNPEDSSSDLEDNADSSGIDCDDSYERQVEQLDLVPEQIPRPNHIGQEDENNSVDRENIVLLQSHDLSDNITVNFALDDELKSNESSMSRRTSFMKFCDENMLSSEILKSHNSFSSTQKVNDENCCLEENETERPPLPPASKYELDQLPDNDKVICTLDTNISINEKHSYKLNKLNESSPDLSLKRSISPISQVTENSHNSTVDIDLVKGIELKLSKLLMKESLDEGSEGDREVKPASEPVLSARAPAPCARAERCSVSCELSPEADVDARFTSRVMITHDRERVSVVTSDTTRLMQHVTVHHTNLQDVPVSPSTTSSLPAAVTVLNNPDTLSTVVCLEEGLADDDSWVEDISHGEDAATTTDSDSDSGGEVALPTRTADFGYCRRSLDFTLHTIVEESCEESDAEHVTKKKQRPISATELEKYFCYGLSDGRAVIDDGDQSSETSSVCSEGGSIIDNEPSEQKCDNDDLVSSRLEKYFLSGFMGFSQERRDSDGSGSVGSDSEGKQSPEQRRKRLVRARGTPRSHSSSLDNLLTGEEPSQDTQEHSDGSSTETEDRHDIPEKCDTTSDPKRKKQIKKTRSPLTEDRRLSAEYPDETRDDARSVSEGEDGKITPRPEFSPLGSELSECKKQTSRDSGFVGSCDDLLRNGDSSDFKSEPRTELEEIMEEIRPDIDERLEGISQSRPPPTPLSRKDSFNNWSSDEETNLMMTKMRQFFKQMIASANVKTSTPTTTENSESTKPPKPPQLLYFESELTRLMKTVPGIRDEEVREIVEYLSSEDTWSDSYDSSDYAGSDLESCVNKSVLRKQISESCREIIDEFDRGSCVGGSLEKDAAGAYQRLAATLSKVGEGSPPMFGKVMRHIGGRLVALMHEVSAGASASTDEDSASEPGALARSKSHDILEATTASRGSVASDCERFSWRGSFESALLAADSRGTLGGGGCESRRSPAGVELAALRSHSRSCGAISGSEDRLWRGRRRASAPDTEPEEEQRSGSLPRLPSVAGAMTVPSAGPVKSARYRAPGFRTATRAASAPGLHVPRRRRPAPPQQHLPPPAAPASAPSLQDDAYIPEGVPQGHATLPRRSNSPLPHDRDGERDRFPINRSGLQARSESMVSVYSGAGEGGRGTVAVKGEIQFSLLYNYRLSALEIGVRRCRDLAAVDVKKNRSDPYVKVYLLPDKSKSGKRKTKVKKNTLNPVFEETLTFTQPLASLSTRTLWLSVWHADMFGRNDFLGEVTLPLTDVVFDDPGPMWYKLQERTEFDEQQSTKGDLIIGLKFEIQESSGNHSRAKGTLHVLVKEAKNLVATKPNGLSDVFCKSYLLPERGRLAKQKTSVSRRTLNPRWEHTFTYRGVTLHELSSRALELSLWDRDRLASNDFMGAVRLSLGTGKYMGASVNWMDSVGKEVTLWQTMMQRPNFWVEGSLPLRPQLNN